jgi:hypothetical protein
MTATRRNQHATLQGSPIKTKGRRDDPTRLPHCHHRKLENVSRISSFTKRCLCHVTITILISFLSEYKRYDEKSVLTLAEECSPSLRSGEEVSNELPKVVIDQRIICRVSISTPSKVQIARHVWLGSLRYDFDLVSKHPSRLHAHDHVSYDVAYTRGEKVS